MASVPPEIKLRFDATLKELGIEFSTVLHVYSYELCDGKGRFITGGLVQGQFLTIGLEEIPLEEFILLYQEGAVLRALKFLLPV